VDVRRLGGLLKSGESLQSSHTVHRKNSEQLMEKGGHAVCYRLWQRADRLASLVSGMFCTPACFRSFTSYPTPGKHCSVPAAKSYSTHAHMYESGSIQRIITLLLPSQPQTSTPGIASGGVHLWLKTAFTYSRLSPCFTSPDFVAAKPTSPLSVLRDCFMGSARLDW